MNSLIVVTVIVVCAAGFHWWQHRSSAPADLSGEIAVQTGADSCDQTGYTIVSKLNGSETPIYDCVIDGKDLCVTEENGVVSDSTATARLLFASVLAGSKPGCAT